MFGVKVEGCSSGQRLSAGVEEEVVVPFDVLCFELCPAVSVLSFLLDFALEIFASAPGELDTLQVERLRFSHSNHFGPFFLR